MDRIDVLAVLSSVVDKANPPPTLPFALGPNLTLERLESDVLERLGFASDQAGWPPPTLDGWRAGRIDPTWCPYAFVRRNPAPGGLNWDKDKTILMAVVHSRLIWPNGVWPRTSGQVSRGDSSNAELKVEPPQTHFRAAYVFDPDTRPWLTEPETSRLARVLEKLEASPIEQNGRVWNARWMAEYAAQTRTVEVRMGHVVTGLESLLNTSSREATAQFIARFPRLAAEVGVPVSKTRVNAIYNDRSKASHGAPTVLGGDAKKRTASQERLELAEQVLRASVLKAIEDEEFGARFASNQTVEAAYESRSKIGLRRWFGRAFRSRA